MTSNPGNSRILLVMALLALIMTSASGCAPMRDFSLKPYKINIQQGNLVKEDVVDQVQPGMTRSQVRFLLGTPMIEDLFNDERWDYIYYLKIGRSGQVFKQHFVVYFEGDQAIRVEKTLNDPDTETSPT